MNKGSKELHIHKGIHFKKLLIQLLMKFVFYLTLCFHQKSQGEIMNGKINKFIELD